MINNDGNLKGNYIEVTPEVPEELINAVVSKFYLFGKFNIQKEIIKLQKKITHIFFETARNQYKLNADGVKILDILKQTTDLLSDNTYSDQELQKYYVSFSILVVKDVYLLAKVNELGELKHLLLRTFQTYGDKEVN